MMSSVIESGGKKENSGEEAVGASVTPDTAGSEARTDEEQKAWAAKLATILTVQTEAAQKNLFQIGRSLPNFEFKYQQPEKLREHLNQEYKVINDKGRITVGHFDAPDKMKTAVSLGVLEMISTSAVPIVFPNGGSNAEKVELLKNLLAVDYSISSEKLPKVIADVREYMKDHPKEEAELNILIALSEINTKLHAEQQKLKTPLSSAERREKLVEAIKENSDLVKAGALALLTTYNNNLKGAQESKSSFAATVEQVVKDPEANSSSVIKANTEPKIIDSPPAIKRESPVQDEAVGAKSKPRPKSSSTSERESKNKEPFIPFEIPAKTLQRITGDSRKVDAHAPEKETPKPK